MSQAGHQVLVQAGAGKESGFTDDFYDAAGAQVVDSAEEVWARSAMILKVKEPVESEWPLMREGQLMFTYFHFAASEALARAVLESGATAVAYETVETADGDLPLLTPMSEVAGRMAVQAGAKYLERPEGGSGVLLGGVPGVLPAKALILGGGVVGTHAAKMAAGLGARVAVMDISLPRLRRLADILPANVRVLYSTRYAVRKQLRDSDLVVGAVLVPGGKAPCLVERSDLADMRPGSVVVDVAVDQGGCVETIRPTTHEAPVYVVDGVVHYGVSNMPGAVPRSSTLALTNATLPYALRLANDGWKAACAGDPALAKGVNVSAGRVVHAGVAEAFGMACEPLGFLLGSAASTSAPGIAQVRFKRLPGNSDLPLPAPATGGAAGYDVRSAEAVCLEAGAVHPVSTGLIMELPAGMECQVRPRSGLAAHHGVVLPNSPGTIDPDYRGELRILLKNMGSAAFEIRRGDRIAQLVFGRFLAPEIQEAATVSDTGRAAGAFGSTGVA